MSRSRYAPEPAYRSRLTGELFDAPWMALACDVDVSVWAVARASGRDARSAPLGSPLHDAMEIVEDLVGCAIDDPRFGACFELLTCAPLGAA